MVQLLFVKGNSVVASVCGYPDSLGYRVEFTDFVTFDEQAVFGITKDAGITTLAKQ